MSNTTCYEPSHSGQRWFRLVFNGDKKNFKLWETRFLAHMELRSHREVILEDPEIPNEDEAALVEDEAKNGEAYAQLVQCPDNKSLSLVMKDAKRDGRRALGILREHYAGKDNFVSLSLL